MSAISTVLFAWTLADPQWIERWLDEAPDGGDGSAERWLVGGCFFIAAWLAAVLARRERRHLRGRVRRAVRGAERRPVRASE